MNVILIKQFFSSFFRLQARDFNCSRALRFHWVSNFRDQLLTTLGPSWASLLLLWRLSVASPIDVDFHKLPNHSTGGDAREKFLFLHLSIDTQLWGLRKTKQWWWLWICFSPFFLVHCQLVMWEISTLKVADRLKLYLIYTPVLYVELPPPHSLYECLSSAPSHAQLFRDRLWLCDALGWM